MLKNNQIVRGVISSIDDTQQGILRVQKDIVYVRHVLLHEEVKVKVIKRIQKGYAGEVAEIIKPSPQRVKVNCPIFERCGSCQLLHMSPVSQQQYKKKQVEQWIKNSKGLSLKVKDVRIQKEPYHYRNKMIIGFRKDKNHKITAGFYEEYSHNIIPYKKCLLHPTCCDDIVATIKDLMVKFRIEPYDEDRKRGLLRHVILRYGMVSKQIMVVLVLNANVFPARKNFVSALLKQHPDITTVVQNVNTRKTSVVLGNEERVLYGPGYIEDTLCGLKFRISAKSFYQINHEQIEVLYEMAIGMLKLQGTERVLDAYCGIGTIGMYASKFAKQVVGVEINKDAIADAKVNAGLNKIGNIRFICDDAGAFMSKAAAKRERYDVVIIDPPRSGSSEEFIRSLASMKPRQVLYISCNPQTQIRDLESFKRHGYLVQGEVQPVDMFPHTFHVESVVLMSRVEK